MLRRRHSERENTIECRSLRTMTARAVVGRSIVRVFLTAIPVGLRGSPGNDSDVGGVTPAQRNKMSPGGSVDPSVDASA
jgi:hypothetical protein